MQTIPPVNLANKIALAVPNLYQTAMIHSVSLDSMV